MTSPLASQHWTRETERADMALHCELPLVGELSSAMIAAPELVVE